MHTVQKSLDSQLQLNMQGYQNTASRKLKVIFPIRMNTQRTALGGEERFCVPDLAVLSIDCPQGNSNDPVTADPRDPSTTVGSRLRPSELLKLSVDPIKYQVEQSKKSGPD